ncbi:MAG: hypothetical protein C5B52_14870 [Bacteroidetes bacterium]|nr:MAG: hypothetical protein C5B52_14870 [Bacteroidota bacterium]
MQPTLREKAAPVKLTRIAPSNISLLQTVQIIFNEHKETGGPLVWTKETMLPGAPVDWQQAKDYLIQKGIISTHPASDIITVLNTEYRDCASYNEAEMLWKSTHKNSPGTLEKIFKYGGILLVAAVLIFVAIKVILH